VTSIIDGVRLRLVTNVSELDTMIIRLITSIRSVMITRIAEANYQTTIMSRM
jgi:hypothetical protein